MNAFKRTRHGRESATYYIRYEYKGRAILKKTPYTNAEQALAWGRAHRSALDKTDHAEIKLALDRARYRKPIADTTIGQITTAYAQLAPLREISPTTAILNVNALHNILRAAGVAARGSESAASITKLNADLIDQYKTATLRRAQQTEDDSQAQSAYRSANSILRQARSIFTPELVDHYRRKQNLNLPDLDPFLKTPGFERVAKTEYHAAPDPLITKTFAALDALHPTDPNAYLAIWLTVGFGLRKSETAAVTPHSFHDIAGRTVLRLVRRFKNDEHIITIPCQLDAWQRLAPQVAAALAAGRAHLLQGTKTERTEETFRRISAWMRTLGWDTQKTHHEFRAWAGCQIAMKHGLLAARDFLRHASITTTEKYYGRYIRQQIPHIPLQLPTATTPTILNQAQA